MTVRMISQTKALHCYILLSVWIVLVILVLYKYFDWTQDDLEHVKVTTELFSNLGIADIKTKRIFKICNFPEEIYQGDEGILDSKKWLLKGLIVLIRHGDRGPLQHVKRILNINCDTEETNILKSYKAYLHNLTVTGKLQWTGPGPFHGFPIVPQNPTQCQLGQLTMQGISQLLNLGSILRKSYRNTWPKINSLKPDEILVHSTRYRRTFQSALSFLYGLISNDTLAKLNILESQSMTFCFKDCECPITEHLKKVIQKNELHQLKSHPAVETLTETTGRLLFSSDSDRKSLISDPHAVRDALLAFVCHRTGLPCDNPLNCIRKHNVAGIIAYTEWINYQKWKNIYWRRLCLLRSYGQMRHIVQQMLHMVGSNGPSLVVYSGHDYTLLQVSTALGMANDALLLRYGSRIILEIYQDNRQNSNDAKGIYFRVLSNGKDVTKQISFCRNVISIDKKNHVCKIEDIVRFLHDDYFSPLNVTNFKDACVRKVERDVESDFFHFR